MVWRLHAHILSAGETYNQETLNQEKPYMIYIGLWLRPPKKKPPKCRSILNQYIFNWDSAVILTPSSTVGMCTKFIK